jgi:ATP-binding cassette subfamily C (CFTR/MRP) protein 1
MIQIRHMVRVLLVHGRWYISAWRYVLYKAISTIWNSILTLVQASRSVYTYQETRFRTRLRGGLIALIYDRALQIRDVDAKDITAVTVMSTDAERIFRSLLMLHEVWASVMDIGIAIWLLERQIGLASIAPIVVVSCMLLDSPFPCIF